MPFVEGVGDEVTLTVVAIILQIILLYYFCRRYPFFTHRGYREEVLVDGNPPPVHNPHTCPICWSEQVLPLETNCGHLYCGICLHTLYNQHRMAVRNGITCPMCRQEVTLLFKCFTNEEKNAPEGSEIGILRQQITTFAGLYNRRHSGGHRSIWDQLRDAPILLRHFFQDLLEGESLENTALNLRLLLMVFICALYLIIPTDFLPEQIFGFLGFIDDLLILVIFILYSASMYRRFLAERQIIDEED